MLPPPAGLAAALPDDPTSVPGTKPVLPGPVVPGAAAVLPPGVAGCASNGPAARPSSAADIRTVLRTGNLLFQQ
jgi:hypothetical protein